MCECCKGGKPAELKVNHCANGDMGVRATYFQGSILIFIHGMAAGYIDTNNCTGCGELLVKVENMINPKGYVYKQ